jgi:hypothetical protein
VLLYGYLVRPRLRIVSAALLILRQDSVEYVDPYYCTTDPYHCTMAEYDSHDSMSDSESIFSLIEPVEP